MDKKPFKAAFFGSAHQGPLSVDRLVLEGFFSSLGQEPDCAVFFQAPSLCKGAAEWAKSRNLPIQSAPLPAERLMHSFFAGRPIPPKVLERDREFQEFFRAIKNLRADCAFFFPGPDGLSPEDQWARKAFEMLGIPLVDAGALIQSAAESASAIGAAQTSKALAAMGLSKPQSPASAPSAPAKP